jgi:preprotein translocase subunit SecG
MGAYSIVSIIILIICALLILIVLVQNSKGGGLASNFSSSNQYMGVRKTADFLEKSTWILAVLLLVFSLIGVFAIPKANVPPQVKETEAPKTNNNAPTTPVNK